MTEKFKIYINAIRPHHWIKNILIFLPSLTSGIIDIEKSKLLLLAFLAFSFVASVGYLFNDIRDKDTDKRNPYKKNRAIASGALSIKGAMILFVLLLVASLGIIIFIGSTNFAVVVGAYLLLTITYSLYLKHMVVADIITLSLLYTLRVVAGAFILSIDLSVWLLSFSILIFLSLATIKRISELKALSLSQEEIKVREYLFNDIIILETLSLVSGYISVVVLIFHFSIEATQVLYSQYEILWLICPIILYWLTRAILITHRGEMHQDPIIFALKDKISLYIAISIVFIVLLAKFL